MVPLQVALPGFALGPVALLQQLGGQVLLLSCRHLLKWKETGTTFKGAQNPVGNYLEDVELAIFVHGAFIRFSVPRCYALQ